MKLNHLDLHVRDVPQTIAFFRDLFGMSLQTKPDSPALAILIDEHGFVLVLQRAKSGPEDNDRYPEGFHLGFLVDDVATVHTMRERVLANAPPATVSEIIVNGRGTMIYIAAPEGYFVEVSCQNKRFDR